MPDLFSNLEDILGKRFDHPKVVTFLDALGETPRIEEMLLGSFYVFPEHGFSFSHDQLTQNIFHIDIYCRTHEFWKDVHKVSKPFAGSLPASVCDNDDRTSVQSKLDAYPKETYTEKAPTIPPPFPEEQMQAFVWWLRRGEDSDPPEIARPVNDWFEQSGARDDAIVADVYDAAIGEWHFWFLIEDQRLLKMQLYSKP